MEEQVTQRPKRKFRKSILAAKVLTICAVGWTVNYGLINGVEIAEAKLSEARAIIAERFRSVEVIREYLPRETKPLSRIVKEASERHGVSSLLLLAMMRQESGKSLRPDRMRYEPHLAGRFKCNKEMTDAECRALSTSWGLMQVIPGFWSKFCGLASYGDLLDPELNIQCGSSIMGDCLRRRTKVSDKMERYRQCLKEYNGGDAYPDEVFSHLTAIVIEEQL